MNWGRRAENIFWTTADRESFINILQETVEGWNLNVSAYCLMSNHYHLLIQTPDGNISRCMRHINGVYTQRFNKRHKKEGQLFRGRYKAVLVDADSYLLEVLRYIHRNPIRAGIAKNVNDYPWSSHHGFLSNAKKWSWLYIDHLMSMFSDKKSRQRSRYIDFVSLGEPEEIENFYSLKNLPSMLGSDSFKEYVKEKFADLAFRKEIPESRVLAPVAADVIFAVCEYYNVSEQELYVSKRGTENLPRDMAIYLVRHYCRETLPTVGRYFGIDNYSTVSSVVERVKDRKRKEKSLQQEMDSIRKKLIKGQKRT